MLILQGWDLVFYGDSITENWSGYSTGRWWTPTTGIPDVFYRYFGSQYRAGILGIAGLPLPPCLHPSLHLLPFPPFPPRPNQLTHSALARAQMCVCVWVLGSDANTGNLVDDCVGTLPCRNLKSYISNLEEYFDG